MTLILRDHGVDAESFDLDGYLATLDPDLLAIPDGRRILTEVDPLAFAMVYLSHHITDPVDRSMTFADPHLDWVRLAQTWVRPVTGPRQWRHVFVAPRHTGKSTWWFLIVPLWAAAHDYARFVAAFADSGDQAGIHLSTFKHELDTNELLRADYPDLCRASRRPSGASEADNQNLYISASGFVFAAKGVDAKNLGMKVGARRPDLIVLDDIEPDEAKYSPYQAGKRLRTITDAILPLNERARVVLVGTVTMAGSIVHQTVKAAKGQEPEPWIKDERFTCHHYDAIVTRPDGSERSTWPAKWPMPYLDSIRHTRSFKKNYANDPAGSGGAYWTEDDFTYGMVPGITRTLLSIDPATTTKTSSDPTGLAVVGWAPPRKVERAELDTVASVRERRALVAAGKTGRCVVHKAWEVRLVGEDLRAHVLRTLAEFPDIGLIVVESNQGGEHWNAILHDMPVKVRTVHNSAPKEVRAADLLHHYQMGRVDHAERLPAVEEQMTAYPNVAHDDLIDSVGTGVFRFIPAASTPKPIKATTRIREYA